MSDKYETKPGVRLPKPEDARPKRFYEQVGVERGDLLQVGLLDGAHELYPPGLLPEVLRQPHPGHRLHRSHRFDPEGYGAVELAGVQLMGRWAGETVRRYVDQAPLVRLASQAKALGHEHRIQALNCDLSSLPSSSRTPDENQIQTQLQTPDENSR